jgi:hypothetical protein
MHSLLYVLFLCRCLNYLTITVPSVELLHDLHNGQVSIEEEYFRKMSQSAIHGGLWEDFTTIF